MCVFADMVTERWFLFMLAAVYAFLDLFSHVNLPAHGLYVLGTYIVSNSVREANNISSKVLPMKFWREV